MRLAILALAAGLATASAQSTNENRNRMVFPPGAKEPIVAAPTPPPQPPGGKRDKPAEIIDLFFLSLKANQVDAAYDALVTGTIIADRKQDVTALKERTKQAIDGYGPISGYEVVDEEAVGTALFRRTCVSFNSDLPLRWRFYFYKSEGVWRLVDLRVDDGLVELFEDAAKARR